MCEYFLCNFRICITKPNPSKSKKIGVVPIRIVWSNVSSIGPVFLWRRANARNVRPYYPYWQYTDLFIFLFVSLLCLRSTLRLFPSKCGGILSSPWLQGKHKPRAASSQVYINLLSLSYIHILTHRIFTTWTTHTLYKYI